MNRLARDLLPFLFLLISLSPEIVAGECTCDSGEEEGRDKKQALKYKLAAIAAILVAGAIGVSIPILGKTISALRPEKNIFFIIKAFAAGVILATSFIHILPDAFDNLTSPCLSKNPWGEFPFAGFVAMAAAIGTLTVDACATSYFGRSKLRKATPENEEEDRSNESGAFHTHATHGHSHGPIDHSGETELLRHRVISEVLELGIIVHSVIIGLSVGASESPRTIRPLVAALTFHQFFEGMGLGGCIAQAQFKKKGAAVMGLFFALTTPAGIVIGIGASKIYNENSPTALIVEGILNAASAGILIYMALVDLLAADFMNPKMQSNAKLQFQANLSLLLGAGCMSLLAKWA